MPQSLSLVVLTNQREGTQTLLSAMAERRIRPSLISENGEKIYEQVMRSRPSAAIIALDEDPQSAWTLCRRIRAISPETILICASMLPSPELILACFRAGSQEFLRLPVDPDEFQTVLARIEELKKDGGNGEKKRGQIIAAFSTKGGCGVSFVAANLAVALNQNKVLLDLNLQGGDQDAYFGIKPRFTLANLVQNRARIDDNLIASFSTTFSENLSILPAARVSDGSEIIRPDELAEVLSALRLRNDFILVDLPHIFDGNTLEVLDQADNILLVMTPDLLAARGAQRALFIFDRLGYVRSKIHLVVNRLDKQPDLDLRQIEEYLNERIAVTIANDPAAVRNSINQGQPVVTSAPNSPIATDMKRLAAFFGVTADSSASRKNLLSTFFKRQSALLGVGFQSLNGKASVGE